MHGVHFTWIRRCFYHIWHLYFKVPARFLGWCEVWGERCGRTSQMRSSWDEILWPVCAVSQSRQDLEQKNWKIVEMAEMEYAPYCKLVWKPRGVFWLAECFSAVHSAELCGFWIIAASTERLECVSSLIKLVWGKCLRLQVWTEPVWGKWDRQILSVLRKTHSLCCQDRQTMTSRPCWQLIWRKKLIGF